MVWLLEPQLWVFRKWADLMFLMFVQKLEMTFHFRCLQKCKCDENMSE